MTRPELTDAGREWAQAQKNDSLSAEVALDPIRARKNGWTPTAIRNSIEQMNRQAEQRLAWGLSAVREP